MTQPTWLDEEPGIVASLREAAEVLRAGLRHGWLTLLVALLFGSALAGAVALVKHDYAPRFVLRVVEANRDPRSMPRVKGQLAEYVRQAIFTSQPMFELIRRHGLYPSLIRKNSRAALDSFREDISVDVYQNYFVERRTPGALPRSAHLAVSYRSADRELALAVTRDLGALIISHELAARRAQAKDAAADATLARDATQRALQQRSEDVLAKQDQLRRAFAPDPKLQVELVGLLGSLGPLERRAEASERRADALDLSAAFERGGIGLDFEVVDDATLPSGRDALRTRLWLAASSFVLGAPLLTMAIGAFGGKRGNA
jgi:hypothetical protein